MKSSFYKCCFCGAPITDDFTTDSRYHSHNAKPLANGKCCQKCNDEKVIPFRLIDIMSKSL